MHVRCSLSALLACASVALSLAAAPAVAAPTTYTGFNDISAIQGGTTAAQSTALLAPTGATSHRYVLDWSWIEKTRGSFWWAPFDAIYQADIAQGIRPLIGITGAPSWAWEPTATCATGASCSYPPARADNADWSDLLTRLARRYPQAAGIEVWNEPNLSWTWNSGPDPVRYTELLKLAYTAVKSINPSEPVLAGALAGMSGSDTKTAGAWGIRPFLQAIYDNGGKGYFDGVSIHAYPKSTQFSGSFGAVTAAKETKMANGDGALPLWITEFGLTTATSSGFTEADQATVVPRLMSDFKADSAVRGVYVYSLIDDGLGADAENRNYGMLHGDLTPKPVYCSITTVLGGAYVCPTTVARPAPTSTQDKNWTAQELLQDAVDAALRYHGTSGKYATLTPAILHNLDARLSSTGGSGTQVPGATADPSKVAVYPAANGDGVILCNTSQGDKSYCVRTYWRTLTVYGSAAGTINAAAGATVNGTSTSW